MSLVVKPTAIYHILSVVVSMHWLKLNVKNAFSHDILIEDVYMKQPPGFAHPKFCTHVYKLRKAIFGLKQVLRA